MATLAQQIDALQQAQVQAEYDGARAAVDAALEQAAAMLQARYPAPGNGRGTAEQAAKLNSLAATLEAILPALIAGPKGGLR